MSPPLPRKLISTGYAALDDAIGGGLEIGKAVMVISRPGAGKTVLSYQISTGAVQFNQPPAKVLLVLTEFGRDWWAQKMCSANLDIPYDVLPKTDFSPKKMDSMCLQLIKEVDNHIGFLRVKLNNFTREKFVEGLRQSVIRHRKKWGKLDLVVLDWLNCGDISKDKRTGMDLGKAKIRMEQACCDLAEELEFALVYFVQADLDANHHFLDARDVSETTGLGGPASVILGISNVHTYEEMPAVRQCFHVSKRPDGEVHDLWVKRDFQYQRFDFHEVILTDFEFVTDAFGTLKRAEDR